MSRFGRRMDGVPIRWKLVLVTLLTSAMAQVFAGALLAVYDSEVFRTQKSHEAQAEAAILASSVTASLTFSDAKAAHEYLDALGANREVDAAAVYGADGTLFVSYVRDGVDPESVPTRAARPGERFTGDRLTVFVPVMLGTEQPGSVYLRVMVEPAWMRMLQYGGIILVALAGSMLIAVPVSMRLNRAISEPIREIAGAAARITTGDLDLHIAESDRDDEIGLLRRAFRQMVASLREMTSELERRVLQRTAQLEAANKELEAFSYSVSHDLRSPLRAIDGFSRMIEEDYGERLDEEGNRLLRVVRDSARRMGHLIDDLLAFSRLGRQAIHPVEIDMTAMAREVCAELRMASAGAAASGGGVAFYVAAMPAARADRPLLRQVWMNLLSNAAKYSGRCEAPEVNVDGEETERELVYRVRDNGAGFDMKYYDKLFGVFQRLHSTAEFSGTGVGLAIVQRIVVRHGGRVWAEGKVGEGATFFFSLPKGVA